MSHPSGPGNHQTFPLWPFRPYTGLSDYHTRNLRYSATVFPGQTILSGLPGTLPLVSLCIPPGFLPGRSGQEPHNLSNHNMVDWLCSNPRFLQALSGALPGHPPGQSYSIHSISLPLSSTSCRSHFSSSDGNARELAFRLWRLYSSAIYIAIP